MNATLVENGNIFLTDSLLDLSVNKELCESRSAMECVSEGYKPTDCAQSRIWLSEKLDQHGFFRQPDFSDYRILVLIFKPMVLSSVRVFFGKSVGCADRYYW